MPNFGETSIPKYGWSKPTIIQIPTAYQQYVARNQSQEDPFVACARNELPPPDGSPYDGQDGRPYVLEHPTRSKWSMGRNLTHPKPSAKADRDEARSEWETVVGDEDDGQMANASTAKATLKSLGLVPETDDGEDNYDANDSDARDVKGKGKKPCFSRPGTPFNAFGFSKSHEMPEPRSLRMDMEASTHPSVVYCGHTGFVRQPVYGGPSQSAGPSRARGGLGAFPINSKTSSDESTDRFKYDGEAYSTFLQPSSTRETKTSKRRPAASKEEMTLLSTIRPPSSRPRRGQKTRYQPSAQNGSEPAVEEDDYECWPRVCNDAGTDADWQTVTTGPVCKMQNQSDFDLIKGTGSSLADVSDIVEEQPNPVEHRRAPGTISHQRNRSIHRREAFFVEDAAWTTPRIRNARGGVSNAGRRRQRVFPELAGPSGRRLSNPFRTPPDWKNSGRVIELDDSPEENQDKDLKKTVQKQAIAPPLTRNDSTETVWPAVPRRKETVNEFDQVFCETQVGDSTLPSDDSANVFSRLPFGLIDLEEAAKCYGSQRYRSADETNSLAERARLGPLWSGSSAEAGPSSSSAYRLGGSGNPPVERPSTAVFRDQVAHSRPTAEFDFIDNTPTPSSAILGSLRSMLNPQREPAQESRFGHFRAAAALGAKCLRIKAPPPETDNGQQWAARNETGGVLTPSEADLIESARGEIMERRRFPEETERKRRILCICIMASSIVFPLIGLLALIGRFDSTVCWYALGETQGFTKEQRGMLLQQLLVEIFVYTIVIVFMALHFSGKL
ncbi:uncharacterized protein TRIVIDRAFT_61928 [Trichoderma virens Gv29-8]|uniref:Uncharacterized protein n=1 Tax=Hypocrea virens (strain Gv29-8 / FGSC 10586) TaxID=413071 RepID=G9MIA6_HYPVG|nr:uncharacterized protein TRIVIDRAFT_61928 [Trichoderma virens Gv29-8]EHK25223.1 hypothetical protein TRIVIDRAFT_61928 [Trichoderma virens Gv29-8]